MLVETEAMFELRGADLLVSACRSDVSSSQLEFHGGNLKWTLVIDGTFHLRCDADNADSSRSLESVAGQSLLVLRARRTDGYLEADFSGGWKLIVFPDAEYEAWEMFSDAGDRLVAVPGNGIAVWHRA